MQQMADASNITSDEKGYVKGDCLLLMIILTCENKVFFRTLFPFIEKESDPFTAYLNTIMPDDAKGWFKNFLELNNELHAYMQQKLIDTFHEAFAGAKIYHAIETAKRGVKSKNAL